MNSKPRRMRPWKESGVLGEEWCTGDTMSVSGSSANPVSGLKQRPPCPAAAWCAETLLGSVEVALGRPKSAG